MFRKKIFLYLSFIAIGLAGSGMSFANSCSIPFNLKTWDYYAKDSIRKGKDWKSNEKTDYWKLVYSWSPTFCSNQRNRTKALEQCRQNFGFIVHGLWAQKAGTQNIRRHPRNCVDAPAVSKRILKENFCLMPDVKLMQKEWEKHGTCDFKKSEQYFAAIQMLNQKIRMPEKRIAQGLQSKSARAISQWLVDNNTDKGLTFEHIQVHKSSNRLKEVIICFDKSFELRSCKSNKKYYDQSQGQKNSVYKKPSVDIHQQYNGSNKERYNHAHERYQKNVDKYEREKNKREEKNQHEKTTEEQALPWWKKLLKIFVNILLALIYENNN